MEIREYQPADRQACLDIMRSNVPEYFQESDLADFARFLDHLPGLFYVVVDPGAGLVACGGICLGRTSPAEAVLCYGMVSGSHLREGLGRVLLRRRLEVFLPQQPQVETISVNTTQKAEGFFHKYGFKAVDREPEGFGPGLDHVRMEAARSDVTSLLDMQ